MRELSDQEKLFCMEYLIDLNATQAALRAGYRPATAKNARQWIEGDPPKKPRLKEHIDREMAKRARRLGVNADRVLREIAKVAFGDPSKVIDPKTGGLLEEIEADDRAMIAGLRVRRGESGEEREVKLNDKLRALDLLGRHLGLFEDGVRVSLPELPKIIAAADGSVEIGGDGS